MSAWELKEEKKCKKEWKQIYQTGKKWAYNYYLISFESI